MPLPPTAQQLEDYVQQLTPVEKKVLQIAKEHLESSFSLEHSIGFQKWFGGQGPPGPPLPLIKCPPIPS